jgi:hypothetical protein
VMQRIHAALRKTRGAAGAMALYDPARKELGFVGVGNVAATLLYEGKSHNLTPHNGTLGAEMRRLQVFSYPCHDETVLVMYSDGLASHWKLENYPGLMQKHPSLIAGVLYRDFNRGRDDTTVLCARFNSVPECST